MIKEEWLVGKQYQNVAKGNGVPWKGFAYKEESELVF